MRPPLGTEDSSRIRGAYQSQGQNVIHLKGVALNRCGRIRGVATGESDGI